MNNFQSSRNISYNPSIFPKKHNFNMFDISTKSYFILRIKQPTWIYLTIIQKTKRGKNRSEKLRSYWYGSLSLVVLELSPQQFPNKTSRSSNDFVENKTSLQNNKYAKEMKFENAENSTENEKIMKDPIEMEKTVKEECGYHHFGNVIGGTFSGSVRASSSVELQLLPGGYWCTYLCGSIYLYVHLLLCTDVYMKCFK